MEEDADLAVQSRHLLERIEDEPIRFGGPAFADELVGREALEGLQATAKVVGRDELSEVASKLIVVVVVEALDSRLLDGAVHSLDLTVGPRVLRLRGAMIDPCFCAGELKSVRPEEFSLCQSFLDLRDRRASGTRRRELDAVVGQHRVDLVGHGFEETTEEVGRDPRCGFSCNSTKANFEVRSMATKRWSLPCSVRTSAMSIWK